MSRNIYTYYKERLTQIGGDSKSLYLSSIVHSSSCDIGKILSGRDEKIAEFIAFLGSDRHSEFTLISKKDKKSLLDLLNATESSTESLPSLANPEKAQRVAKMNARKQREELKKELNEELSSIKAIRAHCEDIEKDTGKNELYVGYPFVFGTLSHGAVNTPVKAPLLLFPVRIDIKDDETVILKHDLNEKILINPSFISAYSYARKINTDAIQLDFDSLDGFGKLENLAKYICKNNISIEYSDSRNMFGYSRFKEPAGKNNFSIRYAAVLSRFSLSQPIYNDYTVLEKINDANEAIDILSEESTSYSTIFSKAFELFGKFGKQEKPDEATYTLKNLDYRQFEAVRKVGDGKCYVINTPPFTGCANVAADMIVDAICKKKRVLLVSDKKMALDSIFNTLGDLKNRCVYINDESTEREGFYENLRSAHENSLASPLADADSLLQSHKGIIDEIKAEEAHIIAFFDKMSEKRPFGLSLTEMYDSSSALSARSSDIDIYTSLITSPDLMALDYTALKIAVNGIKDADLAKAYYEFITEKTENPIYGYIHPNLDGRVIKEIQALVSAIAEENKPAFNSTKYPYYRQIMAYYAEINDMAVLDSAVKHESRIKHPKKLFTSRIRGEIKEEFLDTLTAIREYARDYEPLKRILTEAGYTDALCNILSGNSDYIERMRSALAKYEKMQIWEKLFASTDKRIISILDFAYNNSKDKHHFLDIIEKIIPLRIYHELSKYEITEKEFFKAAPNLSESREKISRLYERAKDFTNSLTDISRVNEYVSAYMQNKDRDKYLADISCEKATLSIKRLVDFHEKLIFSLFPCWLLTPENVSSLLPLKKNLFDVVIFDGASQMFIEEAIPAIYRGKSIAVMGDGKQIHPSAAFMRRMLGNDDIFESGEKQTALEAKSLYDIAQKKLPITKLSYHYGTEKDEFINFSNRAFYSSELIVAPKLRKKQKQRPIELHTVEGNVLEGRCSKEAEKTVELIVELSKKKRNTGSLGVITFTSEQRDCIIEMLNEKMACSEELTKFIEKEKARTEKGKDLSFFVKTIENVQGERRDTIILSPTISQNNATRPSPNSQNTSFDLQTSINVAITRAKQKFILVSGVLPEDIDDKAHGIEIYKRFLEYIKASAVGTKSEVTSILSDLSNMTDAKEERICSHPTTKEGITEKLERMGYTVKSYPGGKMSRISLAIYDEKKDKYLAGVILDEDAFKFSESVTEREIYYPQYLELMGWTILRVTSREWWTEPKKVLTSIIEAAEYNRSDIKNT